MWVRSAAAVQQIQNQAKSIVGFNSQQDVIDQLVNFKKTLESREDSFYNSVGLGAQEFKDRYSHFYSTLGSEQSGIRQMEAAFVEKYKSGAAAINRDEVVTKFVEKVDELVKADPDIAKGLKDFGETGLHLALEALARQNSNIKFSSATTRKQGGGLHDKQVGLGRLQLKISQDRKFIVQKVHADNDLISKDFLKKLNDYLNGGAIKNQLDRAAFLQDVSQSLDTYGLQDLRPLLSAVGQSIDVNASEASIRGFFGEFYALAVLDTLFGPQGATVIPTGSIRKATSGQEIPIDIALQKGLQQFNFQVKNYNNTGGHITLHGDVSAPYFLEQKMQIVGHPLEVLTEFLASYQYNQPFQNETLRGYYENTSMPVERYEEEVYNQFQEIFRSMRYLFDQYAPSLFKIEDVFKAKSGGLFTKEQQYINNFFIVKNRIVPASEIVQQIIDAFKTKPITSYRLMETTNKTDTLEGNFTNYEHSPDENLLAKLVRVSYSITITI